MIRPCVTTPLTVPGWCSQDGRGQGPPEPGAEILPSTTCAPPPTGLCSQAGRRLGPPELEAVLPCRACISLFQLAWERCHFTSCQGGRAQTIGHSTPALQTRPPLPAWAALAAHQHTPSPGRLAPTLLVQAGTQTGWQEAPPNHRVASACTVPSRRTLSMDSSLTLRPPTLGAPWPVRSDSQFPRRRPRLVQAPRLP